MSSSAIIKQRTRRAEERARKAERKVLVGRSAEALMKAAAVGNVEALQTSNINLNYQDRESGWCMLHKSLYHGHLRFASELISEGAKTTLLDLNGQSPFDLLTELVPDCIPPSLISSRGCSSELYTWGINDNLVLGHPNEDNRRLPERVEQFSRELRVAVAEVVFCKYHTVVLTEEGSVFTCGFGRGGRLGHEGTQLVPRQVQSLAQQYAICIAAGVNHTVVLTAKGHVFTFGTNECGQLGCDEKHGSDPPTPPMNGKANLVNNAPAFVRLSGMKNKGLIGCAASNKHTVLFSKNAVYTFGENNGQLGHPKGDRFQFTPRRVSSLDDKAEILQVVANEEATLILLSYQTTVLMLSNYVCRKVTFSINRFPSNYYVHRSGPLKIKSISAGPRSVLAAVSDVGEVYTWSSANCEQVSTPRLVWPLRKPGFRVQQIALGVDQFAVVTDSGHVFTAGVSLSSISSPSAINNIMKRVPVLNRVVKVVAGKANFGAICRSHQPTPILREVSTLQQDLLKLWQQLDEGCDDTSSCDLEIVVPMRQTRILTRKQDCRHKHRPRRSSSSSSAAAASISAVASTVEASVSTTMPSTKRFLAHRVFLSLFSSALKLLWTSPSDSRAKQMMQKLKEQGWDIHLGSHKERTIFTYNGTNSHVNADSMKSLLRGIYTTELGWLAQDKAISHEINLLADSLGFALDQVTSIAMLTDRLAALVEQSSFSDVLFNLADNHQASVHRVLLVSRSQYFNAMLGVRNRWLESSQSTGHAIVSLQHVNKTVFNAIHKFIYSGDTNFLAHLSSSPVPERLEYSIEVLAVANELLLDALKTAAEAEISEMVDTRNVGELLEVADLYEARRLREYCLNFACVNIEVLLEGRLLNVERTLMDQLENYFRQHYLPASVFQYQLSSDDEDHDLSSDLESDEYDEDDYEVVDDRLSSGSSSRRSSISSSSDIEEALSPSPKLNPISPRLTPTSPSQSPQLDPSRAGKTPITPPTQPTSGWHLFSDDLLLEPAVSQQEETLVLSRKNKKDQQRKQQQQLSAATSAAVQVRPVTPSQLFNSPPTIKSSPLASSPNRQQTAPAPAWPSLRDSACMPTKANQPITPASSRPPSAPAAIPTTPPKTQPPPPQAMNSPPKVPGAAAAQTSPRPTAQVTLGDWGVRVTTSKTNQKSRKRAVAAVAATPAVVPEPVSAAPVAPWASSSSSASTALRDILSQELDELKLRQTELEAKSIMGSWALPPPATKSTTTTTTTAVAWAKPPAALFQSEPTLLTSIQRQQANELQRESIVRRKTLTRIQLEEKAISEMTKFYQSTTELGTGTYFTIRQVHME